MSDATVVAGEGTGVAGLSQVERVVDVFVAPSKTYTDILRSASWWMPFLIIVIASVCLAFVVGQQVGFDRVVENVIQASPSQTAQMSSLEPEQRERQMHGMAVGYKYSIYLSSVFILLFMLIYAAILLGCFNFGLGARMTYGQVMAVLIYSFLPYLVTVLLAIVTLYFGGNVESYDFKDPVGTNLGYYLPDIAPWLKAGLGQFDLIKLWTLALSVLGMKIVSKKSFGQTAAVVVGLWLVVLVVVVGATAIFS